MRVALIGLAVLIAAPAALLPDAADLSIGVRAALGFVSVGLAVMAGVLR